MKALANETIRHIGIFRALKLGDLLCSTPAFRALRAAYPEAHITLIGLPWAKEFAQRFSHIFNDFLEFPGYPGLTEQEVDPQKTLSFLRKMQEQKFDLLMQMHGSGTISNPFLALCGAKILAGYYPANLPQLCMNKNTFFPYPEKEHEIVRFLALLDFLGISSKGTEMDFPLTSEDEQNYHSLIQENNIHQPFVIIHPGSISGRRYSIEKFAQIAKELFTLGYTILLTGSKAEKALTDALEKLLPFTITNLGGETELGTLGVLFSKASLFISSDTGVAHMATALDVPSITIFTSADPREWAPLTQQRHKILLEKEANPQKVLQLATILTQKHNVPQKGVWL